MKSELLVLRHAKSAWDTDAESDFERPLAKRGWRDAPRVGQSLYQRNLMPGLVVSSPALRAYQTVLRVVQGLGIKPETIEFDRRIYESSAQTLMAVLGGVPKHCRRLLLVGHNPGLEDLLEILCGVLPRGHDGKLLTTAAFAHLELNVDISDAVPGCGTMRGLYRPRELSM